MKITQHTYFFIKLFACAMVFITTAHGVTRVYVTNSTQYPILVKANQFCTPLEKGNQWDSGATIVLPGTRKEIAWFNRDSGITAGKLFCFEQLLDIGPGIANVRLIQHVIGRTIGSSLYQGVDTAMKSQEYFAQDTNTLKNQGFGLWSDRTTHVVSFGPKNSLRINYYAYFTGGYDNIVYEFS